MFPLEDQAESVMFQKKGCFVNLQLNDHPFPIIKNRFPHTIHTHHIKLPLFNHPSELAFPVFDGKRACASFHFIAMVLYIPFS